MKLNRLLTTAAAMILSAAIFAGCGGESAGTPSATVQLKDGVSLSSIVGQIDDEIGIAMPADIDETALKDVFYVEPADVEEYAGKFAMVMTSADNVLGVKAKPDKVETVRAGLEHRLADVQKSFELYLPEQFDKAKKGVVVTKGNYVFLLIAGSTEGQLDEDMKRVQQIVEEAFA